MDTKVIIVGTSLLVVGMAATLGGTFGWATAPLPVVGVNALQIGGVVVASGRCWNAQWNGPNGIQAGCWSNCILKPNRNKRAVCQWTRRLKAEAYTICNAGFSAYLANEHKEYRLKSFSRGIMVGVVTTVPAYMDY